MQQRCVCAALYIVTYQDSTPVDQNLLAAKSRVAPKETSIPRLELVAAHTLAKLQSNVSKALVSFPITAYHNWVDSITVLCWLANHGEWTTFIRNRVKIGELTESAVWRFVPTTENPSNLGTRGVVPDKLKIFWLKGPSWLSNESDRPEQPVILETNDAKSERNKKEVMLLTEDKAQGAIKSWSEDLLNKFPYWKLLRITAYMKCFINSCRKVHGDGPLTKSEVVGAEEIWVRITQETSNMTSTLRLANDEVGILRCNERIQGYTPIFIPRKSALARSIMRALVKSVRHKCHHCKKYKAKVLSAPPTSALPRFRIHRAI